MQSTEFPETDTCLKKLRSSAVDIPTPAPPSTLYSNPRKDSEILLLLIPYPNAAGNRSLLYIK